jgi:hypothetical protein
MFHPVPGQVCTQLLSLPGAVGTEIHLHRGIRIDRHAFFLAADAWALLVRLQLGTGLVVVEHQRPQILHLLYRRC